MLTEGTKKMILESEGPSTVDKGEYMESRGGVIWDNNGLETILQEAQEIGDLMRKFTDKYGERGGFGLIYAVSFPTGYVEEGIMQSKAHTIYGDPDFIGEALEELLNSHPQAIPVVMAAAEQSAMANLPSFLGNIIGQSLAAGPDVAEDVDKNIKDAIQKGYVFPMGPKGEA